MKKIKKNNDYKSFVDKIFERAVNPIEELQKIFDIHPIFFMNDECIEYINSKLDERDMVLNNNCIDEVKNVYFNCSLGGQSQEGFGCMRGNERGIGCSHDSGSSSRGWCASAEMPKGRILYSCSYGQTSSSPQYGPCNSGGAGWSGCSHASCMSSENYVRRQLVLRKKDKMILDGGNIN